MQAQVRIPTLPPVAPGLLSRPLNWPTNPSSGRVGARKRRLPARSSPAASSVSLFFLGIFFFHPCLLVSFSSWLRNPAKPQPLAILRAHPAPREPHRCRDPPRGQSAARDPGRPRAVVPELNLPSSVGEGCCRTQPIGGTARLGRSRSTAQLGRWRALLSRSCWTGGLVRESHPAGAPPPQGPTRTGTG